MFSYTLLFYLAMYTLLRFPENVLGIFAQCTWSQQKTQHRGSLVVAPQDDLLLTPSLTSISGINTYCEQEEGPGSKTYNEQILHCWLFGRRETPRDLESSQTASAQNVVSGCDVTLHIFYHRSQGVLTCQMQQQDFLGWVHSLESWLEF